MAKYTRRADGRVQTEVKINGKRVFFYGKTDKEVQAKLIAYTKQQEEGPLFADIADEWWQQVAR